MIAELMAFTRDTLVPRANEIILEKYKAYCAGEDTGVVTKADGSPAGDADRQAEDALRSLIEQRYPDHGLWGEEFGATRKEAQWLWVLDPLDGTREFLAKNPAGFGILIGVLHKGRAVIGAISDPLGSRVWISAINEAIDPPSSGIRLKDCVIACTNPDGMFTGEQDRKFIEAVKAAAHEIQTNLNCMGFAKVAEGKAAAAIEKGLSLHDIAALLPVLQSAGKTAIDLDGNDYYDFEFSLDDEGRKFGIIAAENRALAFEILEMRGRG